jgi:hypothetical protein
MGLLPTKVHEDAAYVRVGQASGLSIGQAGGLSHADRQY